MCVDDYEDAQCIHLHFLCKILIIASSLLLYTVFTLYFLPFPPMSDSTVTLRPPVWALLLAVAIGGSFYLVGKKMERMPYSGPVTISVSANAKTSMSPDIASMTFGITSGRQKTAKEASDVVAKQMQKIVDAITQAGALKKDITTQHFSLNPEFDYTQNGQVPRGFQASQSLFVKVRDLDKAGDVLTAAINAGANQAGGMSFEVENPDAAKATARAEAIAKAKEKADVLAKNLGMSVAKMVGFSEDGGMTPMPMMARGIGGGAMDMMMEKSIVLPSGDQEITSTVNIVYELR